MAKRSMFVGMDVHKESIDVSLAEEGRDGEVRHYAAIAGDLEAVAKVVRALRAPNRRLRFVYEAGPCGFGIHRYLTANGEDCVVVNPSSMPKRSGDRINVQVASPEQLQSDAKGIVLGQAPATPPAVLHRLLSQARWPRVRTGRLR
jgi:transposase